MKKCFLYGVLSLFIFSFQAQADFFQSIKNRQYDQALKDIQTLSDINQKDEDGWTALMYAARLGQLEIAKVLIESNADIEAQNHAGLTPFLWATYAGHIDMMKFLTEKGANTQKETAFHENALELASAMNNKEAVRYLLSTIEDEEVKADMAQDALYVTKNEEIIHLLHEAGAKDTMVILPTVNEEDPSVTEHVIQEASSLPIKNAKTESLAAQEEIQNPKIPSDNATEETPSNINESDSSNQAPTPSLLETNDKATDQNKKSPYSYH